MRKDYSVPPGIRCAFLLRKYVDSMHTKSCKCQNKIEYMSKITIEERIMFYIPTSTPTLHQIRMCNRAESMLHFCNVYSPSETVYTVKSDLLTYNFCEWYGSYWFVIVLDNPIIITNDGASYMSSFSPTVVHMVMQQILSTVSIYHNPKQLLSFTPMAQSQDIIRCILHEDACDDPTNLAISSLLQDELCSLFHSILLQYDWRHIHSCHAFRGYITIYPSPKYQHILFDKIIHNIIIPHFYHGILMCSCGCFLWSSLSLHDQLIVQSVLFQNEEKCKSNSIIKGKNGKYTSVFLNKDGKYKEYKIIGVKVGMINIYALCNYWNDIDMVALHLLSTFASLAPIRFLPFDDCNEVEWIYYDEKQMILRSNRLHYQSDCNILLSSSVFCKLFRGTIAFPLNQLYKRLKKITGTCELMEKTEHKSWIYGIKQNSHVFLGVIKIKEYTMAEASLRFHDVVTNEFSHIFII